MDSKGEELTAEKARRRKRSKSKESSSRKKQSIETEIESANGGLVKEARASKDSLAKKNTANKEPPVEKQQSTSQHSFETNALDHCETPREAYEHLSSCLETMGKLLKVQPATKLRIWDPFYCDGSMKTIFRKLGFTNIIHDNVDFYQLMRDDKIPEHDILVTNPPYSDDHIHRLLDFVVTRQAPNQRPSCLLLPNWVARQPDYDERFTNVLEKQGHELFYLSPVQPYTYTMPSWVSKEDRPEHVGNSGKTTPYVSSWYLVVPKQATRQQQRTVLDRMDALAKQQRPHIWVVAKTVKGLKWKIKKVHQRRQGKKKDKRK